jgi:hypothetical protein
MKILNKIINLVLLISIISCSSFKEIKTEKLYNKWEQSTKTISRIKTTNKLEIDIQTLVNFQLCKYDKEYINHLKTEFPNLKYRIVQDKIKVTMLDKLTTESYFFPKEIIFKDSLFINRTNCDNGLTTLILTEKYKNKVLGKLKYGFGSSSESKNKKNARAILESHHSSEYYRIPFKINEILFNKSIDSAIVITSSTYHENGEQFIRKEGKWVLDKEIYHSVE